MFVGVSQWLGAAPRQNVLEKEITISLKDVTLRQALVELEAQTGVKFVYSSSYLRLDERVTIDASSRKLGQLLSELLTPLEIRFAVHESENFVVLTQARTRGLSVPSETESSAAFSYATLVTGRVTDEQNAPMAGVNVVEKGTANGTSTDADGKFALETRDNPTLLFSFIGFKTQEVEVGSRSVVDIVLEEDRAVLETVMVNAGYWKVSEREQTGSISRVTAKEIQQQPVGNPIAAMIGRMPGVNIQQTSGLPGTSFQVRIRGRNSLRLDGNDPLYVVDGVPISTQSISSGASPVGLSNPLSGINPADIESIEILKDADATAIYGTRGANGVVLITTKKGHAGKTTLDVNVYTGAGQVGKFMKLLSTQDYMTMRREAHRNDGMPVQSYEYDLLPGWDTTRYTDWQRALIGGTANVTNAQLSVSGGSEIMSFNIGGGFFQEGTVMPGNFSNKKINTHYSISHRSSDKKFEVNMSGTYVFDDNTLPNVDLTGTAIRIPPLAQSLYKDDGSINWANGRWPGSYNPIGYTKLKYSGLSHNLVSNLTTSYEVLHGLRLKLNLGYVTNRFDEKNIAPFSSYDPDWGITTAYAEFGINRYSSWIAEPQVEFNKQLGVGRINILAGTTFQQSLRQGMYLIADGFTNDALLDNIRAATSIFPSSSTYTEYKYNAAFARLNYTVNEKYLINLTGRRDGSSRFGPGKQFANFGAIGAGWIFSKESFVESLSFLSFGKLRASYGLTGSDQIPDYGYLDSYNPTTYPYMGRGGLIPARLANPDYRWEKTWKGEVALEVGFLNDKIFAVASYYDNRSSNQLVGYSLPQMTGFNTIQFNLPATVRNYGAEVSIRTVNVDNQRIQWESNITLTAPRNVLLSYQGLETSSNANRLTIGRSLSTPKGYHFTGVDPQTGLYTFEDVNRNGVTLESSGDRVATKDIAQFLFGGISNTVRFSGVEINVFVQGVRQNGRDPLARSAFGTPGSMSNQPVAVLDRWQRPGDVTNVQKFSTSSAASTTQVAMGDSDRSIIDTSFIRLKSLSVSYSLPSSWIARSKFKMARIYLQGQNLWTATRANLLDPEQSFAINMPALRVLTGGIQFTL